MGERNLAYHLARFLEERHSISRMRPRDLLNIQAIRGLWRQRPDVIHYLTGPRAQSFVVLRILKFIGHCRVSLVSAVRPVITENRLRLAGRIKPDLILAQSLNHIQVFERNGFKAVFFPNGVDTNKFRPVNHQQKNNLRRKYRVPLDKFVVLHTGYIARRRGVGIFARLAREPEICVVLVSATSWIKPDPELLAELEEAGCQFIIEFLPNIEEIYQLSDCFVFPGAPQKAKAGQFEDLNQSPSIEIPLCVLEALACNLTVVSRKYGGLEYMFPQEKGIIFADDDEQILEAIRQLRSSPSLTRPAELIEKYRWETIAVRLEHIYSGLLMDK
jgi:glycosyltransferase involved in cell wall biosynthesis